MSTIVSLVPHKTQGSETVANAIAMGSNTIQISSPSSPSESGKQRMRWTEELHNRFVDAITQLGGPDSGSNTKRSFTSDGCTWTYHLPCEKSFTGSKDVKKGSLDVNNDMESSPGFQISKALRMQMEVQKRLHEQLEVQKQLQMRIEAQGKYLQKIIEEQQKLGIALRASETQDKKEKPPEESQTGSEASLGSSPPWKKQKVEDSSTNKVDNENDEKQDLIYKWDRNMYGSVAGFGLDMETEFKVQENGGTSSDRRNSSKSYSSTVTY